MHYCILVWRHFVRNRCLIRASALAYTTLLAIIPLLAVVISVSSSLLKNQDEDKFYQAIASIAPPLSMSALTAFISTGRALGTNPRSQPAPIKPPSPSHCINDGTRWQHESPRRNQRHRHRPG